MCGIFIPTIACVIFACVMAARRRQYANGMIVEVKQAATHDRRELYLSTDGQPHTQLSAWVDTVYSGNTRNNAAKRSATFQLHIDNHSRAVTATGTDAWGTFDIRGQLTIGSPTQGWLAFTKAYPTHSCKYAGEFNNSSQPLSVSGSWTTTAGASDFGTFTMTFKQPVSIINSASEATVAIPIHDGHGMDESPVAAGRSMDVEMTQPPPPAYQPEYQPQAYQQQETAPYQPQAYQQQETAAY